MIGVVDCVVFEDFEVERRGWGGLSEVAKDTVDAVHWGPDLKPRTQGGRGESFRVPLWRS